MNKMLVRAITVALIFSATGCASIVSKSSWPVTIQSNPTGAKCTIAKKDGVQIQTGETPMTVSLSSKDGFFSYAAYSVACKKDGFQPVTTQLEASLNGWYLGNIVFGGLIGILIVDPATGAMWKMDDTHVVQMAVQDKAVVLDKAAVVKD